MAKGTREVEEFSYYEYQGACFRGPRGGWPVEAVLVNGKWVPYTGKDRIAPITFGDLLEGDPIDGSL